MKITEPKAAAHINAGPSERAAQRRAARMAGSLRSRVLAAVVVAGELGLTLEEALEGLDLPERKRYSVAPRLSELLNEGLVEKSPQVREGFVAYTATEAGRDEFPSVAA